MEKSSILKTLVSEYSRTSWEAERKLERAKLEGVVFEPVQGVLCLLKQ